MMKVTIRIFGELTEILGNRHELELTSKATVNMMARELGKMTGQNRQGYFGEYRVGGRDIAILVNGRNIDLLNGVNTALRDGDDVVILLPSSGG